MRAITITNRYQQIRHSGRLTFLAGVAACALVAPAGAAAMADYPVSSGPESTQQSSSEFFSLNSLTPPSGQPSGSAQSDPSTVSSITGGGQSQPVTVSSPGPEDGFDWSDAGVAALVAAALAACAGASVLVARRHSTLSPSA
jgi:hypothetical protein